LISLSGLGEAVGVGALALEARREAIDVDGRGLVLRDVDAEREREVERLAMG